MPKFLLFNVYIIDHVTNIHEKCLRCLIKKNKNKKFNHYDDDGDCFFIGS